MIPRSGDIGMSVTMADAAERCTYNLRTTGIGPTLVHT